MSGRSGAALEDLGSSSPVDSSDSSTGGRLGVLDPSSRRGVEGLTATTESLELSRGTSPDSLLLGTTLDYSTTTPTRSDSRGGVLAIVPY